MSIDDRDHRTVSSAEETAAVGPPGGGGPHLVFGDDSSAAADVAWQWIAHHEWPGGGSAS